MNRLLAISDIHGCYETFQVLVINRLNLQKSDRLFLLGDYIDRGEKSREVIDLILDLISKGYDITPLAGNHEWMLTETMKNSEMQPLWYMNSGILTIKSFNINEISEIEKRYSDFFLGLRYYETAGKFIFVHAGFNDNSEDPFSDIHSMIWEPRQAYGHPLLSNKIIIHGHRPKTTEHVKRLINSGSTVIPIDTGCVYDKELGYGFLSALEVNSMTLISAERI